jgi:hypothetical protein
MSIMSLFNENNMAFRVSELLVDFDIRALGCACKILNEIASKILECRDRDLEKIVGSFYTNKKTFNVISLKDAEKLFVGDRHKEKSCQDSQKNLIHFLSKRRPVVLVLESLPSLKIFTKEELENVRGPIDLIVNQLDSSENIYYVGWDDAESVKKIKERRDFLQKPFQEGLEILNKQADELQDEINQLVDQINEKGASTTAEIEEMATNAGIQEIVEELGDPGEVFTYLSEIGAIESDKRQQIEDQFNEISDMEKTIQEKIDAYNTLIRKIDESEDDYQEFIHGVGDKKMGEILSRTFPTRTQSITHTVSKISDFIFNTLKLKNPIFVIIAGQSHLVMKKNRQNNGNYNLDIFYKELANHKAVILMPTVYLNEFETEGSFFKK